jgi:hypothetical protein
MKNFLFPIFLFLIACAPDKPEQETKTSLQDSITVFTFTGHAVGFLKEKNLAGLSRLVHPEKGVVFHPFGHIDPQTAVTLMPEEIKELFKSRRVMIWGHEDGTGDPIEMTFQEYYEEYLFEINYLEAPVASFNKRAGKGNSINNIGQIFPNAVFAEYHFPGFDEQYKGMDWLSLRVVVEQYNGLFYIVALVNDRWTI